MPCFQALTFAICFCLTCFTFSACTYHNPASLDPLSEFALDCQPEGVNYDSKIVGLLKRNCGNCHWGGRADGGVRLDDYESVLLVVDNGSLMGSLEYEPGYMAMPPSGDLLSDCDMLMLWAWIDAGAPQ